MDHVNPYREHSPRLLALKTGGNLEFWFSIVQGNRINDLEKQLIVNSKPSKNIIRYGGYCYDFHSRLNSKGDR